MERKELTFDSLAVGQQLPSYTHTLTAEEIDQFCKWLGEDNPIYFDDVTARKLGFEGKVAPPMMVRIYAHMQNVLGQLTDRVIPGHTIHARGEYQFVNPARPGDVLTTTGVVLGKSLSKTGRKLVTFEFITTNQLGKTVVINRHTSVWPR